MTNDFIIEDIKNQLERYLRTHSNVNLSKPHFRCLNPAHTDTKPSMAFDRKRNKAHCFSCGADYDVFDIIGIEYGLSEFKDQMQKAKELFNISDNNTPTTKTPIKKEFAAAAPTPDPETKPAAPDFSEYLKKAHLNVGKTDYFKKRGLSQGTIDKYMLGYDPEAGAVIIPITKGYYIKRSITDKKYFNLKNAAVIPFNLKALKSAEPVFVTEGAFDALSIIEAGGQAAALNGATHIGRLVSYIKDNRISPTIVISLDNDDAGRDASQKLLTALKEINVQAFEGNVSGDQKDPNEALTTDKEQFAKSIQETINQVKQYSQEEKETEREKYINETSVTAHIENFIGQIKKSVDTPAISTQFPELDRALDDGLYEGLYILGAISSLGKTTFILQVADQIAQQGQDVLIFSLEMARSELMAKSISRLTFLGCNNTFNNAKTTRGITSGKRHTHYSADEKALINDSIMKYASYTDHLFIHEGMGDIGAMQIREIIQKHIKATGNKPVVIIDYLQILAPADPRSTDKQNTDRAVFELKRTSRDFKIPIISVSSLNRENYTANISMAAFKESGAIEYSSDVLMGLQFEAMGDTPGEDATKITPESINRMKRQQPRKVELKILKNRNGATGDSVTFDYYPMFNYFKETGLKVMDSDPAAATNGKGKRIAGKR